ncbi:uncharacterized protein LOC144641240 [Oculina patagonica]
MERKDKVELKKDAAAGFNNNARLVLPKIEGTKRRSLTGSETFSLITSTSSLSPDIDSDLEDMALQEEDEEEDGNENEEESGENERKQGDKEQSNIQLSITSEKEIRQRAKEVLKKELRRIRLEAASKKNDTRRKFKTVIDEARSQLIASRIEAEKVSIDRLEERAEMQQAMIIQERAQRKKEGKGKNSEYDKSRAHSEELASLRKIQSDLDRARARRKHSLAAALTTVNGKAKVANLLQHEVKRLERAEEVQKIIVELYSLGLTESAIDLTHALRGKEESENKFRAQLHEDQVKAKRRAAQLVESEITKVRQECLAEMERKERERAERERLEKERQERERREREMAKLKKMARDMAMKKMYKESMFNTSVSRPFSFSYFPSLKK